MIQTFPNPPTQHHLSHLIHISIHTISQPTPPQLKHLTTPTNTNKNPFPHYPPPKPQHPKPTTFLLGLLPHSIPTYKTTSYTNHLQTSIKQPNNPLLQNIFSLHSILTTTHHLKFPPNLPPPSPNPKYSLLTHTQPLPSPKPQNYPPTPLKHNFKPSPYNYSHPLNRSSPPFSTINPPLTISSNLNHQISTPTQTHSQYPLHYFLLHPKPPHLPFLTFNFT